MEEDKEEIGNLVIDTNVIIASLIKSEGLTRAALVMLSRQPSVRMFMPKIFREEVSQHSDEIARKARLDSKILKLNLEELLKNITVVDEVEFKEEMTEAKEFVRDEDDTSFAALALKHRPSINSDV